MAPGQILPGAGHEPEHAGAVASFGWLWERRLPGWDGAGGPEREVWVSLLRPLDRRGFYKVYFVCPSVPNNLVTKSVVNQKQRFAILICSRCCDRGSAVETICASSVSWTATILQPRDNNTASTTFAGESRISKSPPPTIETCSPPGRG